MKVRHLLPTAALTVALAALAGAATLADFALATPSATAAAAPALSLLAEPQAGSAPFLKMIGAARHSIDLTMYELTDPTVERALATAAGRGVDVRVAMNGGYYSQRESTNDQAYTFLRIHHVHVEWTPTYFPLTHQKTLTIDNQQSVVMTLNFDGLYPTTRDFAIVDRQPADVNAIVATFNADWTGHKTTPSTGTGDLVWSPGAESLVLHMISAAKTSIDVEDEEMDAPAVTDALCDAAKQGVNIRVVMTYESDWTEPLGQLARCGAHIALYHGQKYYIHAKILVVDGHQAVLSSQNFSVGSLQYNRELGILVTQQALVDSLTTDFDDDYAGAAS